MKAKISCIISLVSFMLIMGSAPVTGKSESKEKLLKFYESCIQKKISNCNAKTVLRYSRSENLRRKAKLSMQQIEFLTSHQDILINEMFKLGIGYKQYKVEYYLNKRFFEMNP